MGKYTDMEACKIWVAIFFLPCTSDFTICHYFFLFFGSPSQCMEFHCGDNKMKKRNHKKKKKQQMYNWSFVRLPYCVSFSDVSWCVCETVPHLPLLCILSLSTQSHWSLLHKGGRTFLFKLCWIGSPLGVVWWVLFFFLLEFCSSTLNSVG